MGHLRRAIIAGLALALAAGGAQAADKSAGAKSAEGKWKPIFNGRNLDGWTPKLNHHPAGENWRDTFRAGDGVLRVSYDKYDRFTDEFGHLVYKRPLSSYRIRFEYRFVGPQTPGAPAWAVRNSGIMIHGQAADAMQLNQPFPISIEAQLLGGATGQTRPTGNVCTPGTSVVIDGALMKEHCRNSKAPTFQDGEWVRFEVEVHGARLVRQIVNGETVFEYGDVRLAPAEYKGLVNLDLTDPRAAALEAKGPAPLDRGYISLQAEGHPIEFRKIELMELKE